MARRSGYSAQKRRRESDREQKRRDKAERRQRLKNESEGGIPVATAEELQSAAFEVPAPAPAATEGGGGARTNPALACRLFVGSLSWETSDEDLAKAFAEVGEVLEAKVVKDQATGDSRGFGFVSMASRKHAMKAIRDLNGAELHGRSIRVDFADR